MSGMSNYFNHVLGILPTSTWKQSWRLAAPQKYFNPIHRTNDNENWMVEEIRLQRAEVLTVLLLAIGILNNNCPFFKYCETWSYQVYFVSCTKSCILWGGGRLEGTYSHSSQMCIVYFCLAACKITSFGESSGLYFLSPKLNTDTQTDTLTLSPS
jgi:hypothetical protein